MTVPSTEELQWLLDAATPGPWVASKSGCIGSATAGTMIHDGQVLGDTEADTDIIALAPVLAAEVIRLREEIKTLREHYRELEKGYDDASIPFSPGRWFSHNAIQDLTRILEGDQE